MKIIHGKTYEVPNAVTVEMLVEVSAVVDDLGCYNAFWFFA